MTQQCITMLLITELLGESYMAQKWNCDQLEVFFDKILWTKLDKKIKLTSYADMLKIATAYLFNQQPKFKSYEVEDTHYNLDNNLYKNMLGETMAYSCAYWKNVHTLDEAQYAKFDLICRKLYLQPGDNVLDIGSGFGCLAKYMATKYGCNVTGINISKEQLKYAQQSCKELIEKKQVKFIDCDYRDIPLLDEGKKYDKIVSVGFAEHVSSKNYLTVMTKCNELLKDGGLFLLHTIGGNQSVIKGDVWIDKYIFPTGVLPSIEQLGIGKCIENIFVMEDLHNFGPYYSLTLKAWYDNYTRAIQQNLINKDEKFNRMWTYYLLSCAAGFKQDLYSFGR